MLDLNNLTKEFEKVSFREKRTGLYKVILPFFYEDGDMFDVFIEEKGDILRLSDYGLTLMKLSYSLDINSPNKIAIVDGIVTQNRCHMDDGAIYLDIKPNQFTMGIYQFVQTLTKVSTIDVVSRESVKSCFYEFLSSFIDEKLSTYNFKKNISPTENKDLIVDFILPTKKPIFLFGVNDNTKAAKVVISCLTFSQKQIPYSSLIIHEDFSGLSKFNRNQLTNNVDKQFTSLEQFEELGTQYIMREIA